MYVRTCEGRLWCDGQDRHIDGGVVGLIELNINVYAYTYVCIYIYISISLSISIEFTCEGRGQGHRQDRNVNYRAVGLMLYTYIYIYIYMGVCTCVCTYYVCIYMCVNTHIFKYELTCQGRGWCDRQERNVDRRAVRIVQRRGELRPNQRWLRGRNSKKRTWKQNVGLVKGYV